MQPLVLGATGRVGRALRASGLMPGAIWQARRATPGAITWDILNTPPPPLPQMTGVIMLAGGTQDTDHYTPLAKAAADLGAAKGVPVLIASSQAVYGPQAGPLPETTKTAPNSVYGRAKRAMEQAVAQRDGVTCLRIGNVAGTDALFRSMTAGPVHLDEAAPGQGPRRAMIGPLTLARALLALLETDPPKILNLAQPGLIDMAEVLRAAGAVWRFRAAPDTVLPALDLDVTRAAGLIPLPRATPAQLVAEARAAGWACA